VTIDDSLATKHVLSDSEVGFRVLADAMPQIVWSTLADGFHDYYNKGWYDFTGMPGGSTDGEGWNGMFHPDDQPRAWKLWAHCLATGAPYEIDYRLRHHSGAYRWVIGRANPIRAGDGRIVRWIGTCTDVDAARRQAEQNEILSRELSHRIKNIFAVISGLIGLSVRQAPEAKVFAESLRQRISALGRAHECARPHSDESRMTVEESTLQGMLREMLRPYPALDEGRITISGDDVAIDDRGATPLALVFHELATNAAKYGALSMPDGHLAVSSRIEGDLLLVEWVEQGGPPLHAPPSRSGFGTRLVDMSVHQVSGTIERAWDPNGLRVKLMLHPPRLVRR
jgi:PAS domain S-box-containing protein